MDVDGRREGLKVKVKQQQHEIRHYELMYKENIANRNRQHTYQHQLKQIKKEGNQIMRTKSAN
jgi:hypothetical protein